MSQISVVAIGVPETVQVVILAIIQGVAEFLPISSSGHLVVAEALMGNLTENAELSIVLHFGTLLAILVFYKRRILALLNEDRRVIPLLIVGTIPAAVIGIWLKLNYEWLLKSPLLAGFMLPVTGFMLMLLTRISSKEIQAGHAQAHTNDPATKSSGGIYRDLSYAAVLVIGLAQAFALLPGISRSGATIVMGTLLGLQRQQAATFSFLLAIPAIAGASVLEANDMLQQGAEMSIWLLAIGAAIAFGVGLFSLRWLVHWIEQGKLHWFAYWLMPFGFSVVIWQLYELISRQMTV